MTATDAPGRASRAASSITPATAAPRAARIESFDVFDTALVRTWLRPGDLFESIGELLVARGVLAGPGAAQAWAAARVDAELALRRTRGAAGVEEVTLGEIHQALGGRFGLDAEGCARSLQAELDAELHAVRPVRAILREVAVVRARGDPVMFVSDIYLAEEHVRSMLRACGYPVDDPVVRVFTSASRGVTKHTGRLYGAIAAELLAASATWHHRGDSRRSDVQLARRSGLRATHVVEATPTAREERLYQAFGRSFRRAGSAIAGSARAARVDLQATEARAATIEAVGATVAGPVLASFALWCLHAARRAGANRIYFLARDGQVIREIAARFAGALGWEIDCRYLLGSRQALHLPSLRAFDDDFPRWFLAGAVGQTARQLLRRLRIDPATDPVAPNQELDAPLDLDRARAFAASIVGSPALAAAVLQKASEQRQLLTEYLEAQGWISRGPQVVVDVGWVGRMQQSLYRVLAGTGVPELRIIGLYFGLLSMTYASPGSSYATFHRFARRLNVPITEVMTSADHGSVVGYMRRSDGSVDGELSSPQNREALAWGLMAQRAGIARFVDNLLATAPPAWFADPGLVDAWRGASEAQMADFMEWPSVEEARAFGDFGACDDQLHEHFAPVAPVMSPALLARSLAGRGRGLPTRWISGSIARSVAARGPRRALLALASLRSRAAVVLKRE